jgi:hypothetical protein
VSNIQGSKFKVQSSKFKVQSSKFENSNLQGKVMFKVWSGQTFNLDFEHLRPQSARLHGNYIYTLSLRIAFCTMVYVGFFPDAKPVMHPIVKKNINEI